MNTKITLTSAVYLFFQIINTTSITIFYTYCAWVDLLELKTIVILFSCSGMVSSLKKNSDHFMKLQETRVVFVMSRPIGRNEAIRLKWGQLSEQ